MRFGVIGGGSWATALAKILTDNRNPIQWWIRNEAIIRHLKARHHNPQYLSSVYFDTRLLSLSSSVSDVVAASDCLVMAVPSAYMAATLEGVDRNAFRGKKVLSAIKGILPEYNLLLNEYLEKEFGGVHRFLNSPYPDGANSYVDRIEANLRELKQRLSEKRSLATKA